MASSASESLRLTNERVRGLLNRMQHAEDQEAVVRRQDFDSLLIEVTRLAVWLRRLSPPSLHDSELAEEISHYRSSLEQLQLLLPAVEKRLIAEKVRLESERAHLMAARAWANVSRGTL